MTAVLQTEHSALVLHALEPDVHALLSTCIEAVDAELDSNPEIIVYGKVCHQHRSVGFYSDTSHGYNYSTTHTPSKPMHDCLRELMSYINHKFDCEYNGILINKYSNGEDYIGRHSDDERGLDAKSGVIALSFGETRTFRIRHKATGKIVSDAPTDTQQIIQTAGDFQKEFTHEVPVQKKSKGLDIHSPLESMTFKLT